MSSELVKQSKTFIAKSLSSGAVCLYLGHVIYDYAPAMAFSTILTAHSGGLPYHIIISTATIGAFVLSGRYSIRNFREYKKLQEEIKVLQEKEKVA